MTLWDLGLSVIPVPRPGGTHDGKRPIIAWKQYQQRRPTEQEIRRWFAGPSNNAIVTGAVSGVVVVDVDSPEAVPWVKAHLVRTPWIVKTARGWHCYYRHPGVAIGNRAHLAGMKLDVRGDGGYVIGPGSIHASGHIYRRTGDWWAPMKDLPVLNVALLERPAPRPSAPPSVRPAGGMAERARKYLARVERPVVGQGSDAHTFRAACKLVRGFALPTGVAVELLSEWAPDFDRWWLEKKIATAMAFGSEPFGARR